MTSRNMARLAQTPPNPPLMGDTQGKVRVWNDRIDFASQAAGSYPLARLPRGARPLFGILIASASLGTSTLAIGIAGATGKYRTAATFTAVDTPTMFGNAAAMGDALTAAEEVLYTVATAALPSSGHADVQIYYALDN